MVMPSRQISNVHSGRPSATLGTGNYAYHFDNIGNRITAEELTDEIAYVSNNLNQYTSITKDEGTAFIPTFDDDGNQLTVQTATGVWSVTYNAENRPVTFTQGTTVIECKYDSQGRRFEKKVTANGTVTFWQRYAYRGYLQIAAFNVTLDAETEAEVYTLATTTMWDPMEQTATRPLAFTDHTAATPATYFYTHDLTKNVCELLNTSGAIVTNYDYTPFGAVTASNSATPNTFMFSSEVYDPETALVYYNYRHYNPLDGRWINRDPIEEDGGWNLYGMLGNGCINRLDTNGLLDKCECKLIKQKITWLGIIIRDEMNDLTEALRNFEKLNTWQYIQLGANSVPQFYSIGTFAVKGFLNTGTAVKTISLVPGKLGKLELQYAGDAKNILSTLKQNKMATISSYENAAINTVETATSFSPGSSTLDDASKDSLFKDLWESWTGAQKTSEALMQQIEALDQSVSSHVSQMEYYRRKYARSCE